MLSEASASVILIYFGIYFYCGGEQGEKMQLTKSLIQ